MTFDGCQIFGCKGRKKYVTFFVFPKYYKLLNVF